jgi:hypothetical protein
LKKTSPRTLGFFTVPTGPTAAIHLKKDDFLSEEWGAPQLKTSSPIESTENGAVRLLRFRAYVAFLSVTVSDWVEKKVRSHLARARQRQGFGWKRWRKEWLHGTLGLFHEYRVVYQPRAWAAAPIRSTP